MSPQSPNFSLDLLDARCFLNLFAAFLLGLVQFFLACA